jgi:hypothetical protein
VISLAVENGSRIFVGDLDGGEAYVDADWLSGVAAGPVPALLVRKSSLTSTWDGETLSLPASRPDEHVVAEALVHVAVAAAAEARSAQRPFVSGRGFVAEHARELLGALEAAEAPDLVVETRGDPDSLVDSTRRVADLGVVVLAGVPNVDPFRFDLYPDVHVRGLHVVALPLVLELVEGSTGAQRRRQPVHVRLGEPIADAHWYRITSG